MPYVIVRGNLGLANTKVHGLPASELERLKTSLRLGDGNVGVDGVTFYNAPMYVINQLEYFYGYRVVGATSQGESNQPVWTMGGDFCRVKQVIMAAHDCHSGCHGVAVPSVHQTLQEMEFERGIWKAGLEGDVDRVSYLLSRGISPNCRDQAGYTALHYASRPGHSQVCRVLLEAKADPDLQTPSGGATALQRAAYCGRLDTMRLLLGYRADPALCDTDGKTALHKCVQAGHVEAARLLLQMCPELKTMKDKKDKVAAEYTTDSTLLELLQ